MSIATVILAAGGAQRMGRPKQLMPVGGQPMRIALDVPGSLHASVRCSGEIEHFTGDLQFNDQITSGFRLTNSE